MTGFEPLPEFLAGRRARRVAPEHPTWVLPEAATGAHPPVSGHRGRGTFATGG